MCTNKMVKSTVEKQPLLSSYHTLSKKFSSNPEFLCGWGAAFINITVTFPLNKMMFRQQLHGVSTSVAFFQLYKEGLWHLYRGLLPPLLQKTTCLAVMFGIYHRFHIFLNNKQLQVPEVVSKAIAAILAGSAEAVITPLERIQTLMQDRKYQNRFNNTFHAFWQLKNYGVREFYRGLTPILMRNGPSNILFFLGRDFIKSAMPKRESDMINVLENFFSGALLGAVLGTMFYPINVVKTRMQSKLGGEFVSFSRMYLVILSERDNRMRNLFRGVHLNYIRSFVSWGIINASYEYLLTFFRSSTPEKK